MRWKIKEHTDSTQWHHWFAWRPVTAEGERVWLEWVWRRWVDEQWPSPYHGWIYTNAS